MGLYYTLSHIMKIRTSKFFWVISVALLLILACWIYMLSKEDVPKTPKDHMGYPF